ncbi:oleate hydratase [Paraburkholderia phenoliruptrix]|uniref:oleate hydratase n=1 Tax=Paraburkholderia phenoliruptrix TaxID=252970 RepID=UPI002869994C|nr:oleate hydratase [Paraburkholderia phenoliruptrix]WMY12824.1 oleate hydratase [Paraburkholderia phenoliruptrix]
MGRRRLTCINGVAVAAPGAPLIQRNERPGRAGMVYTFTAITRGDHQMNHDEYAGTRPLTAAARNEAIESGHFYLVGGGIASLAAAAFLIRDADVPGCRITILEALGKAGGSLDGAGTPQDGYVVRGGRMLESKYLCTYDLFDSIPTLDGRSSVTKEIFDWNETIRTSSKSRLVRDGKREDAPAYGLGEAHLLTLGRLSLEPEALLGDSRISDHFEADFFETNFWIMWCTTFAFQPWHSAAEFRRYLLRFAHMTPGFNQLHGIMRTVYNQYDSMVRPLRKWLDEHGVVFLNNTRVVDLRYDESGELNRVAAVLCEHDGRRDEIALGPHDKVMITLGSMTAGSSLGATDRAAVFNRDDSSGAWALWKTIAAGRGEFGHPSVFADHVDESRWLSFTATLHDPTLFRLIRDLTGNVPGEGGLITFAQSNWRASIVLPHQPHFIGQPKDVQVLWGYGLFIDRPGNFVAKPMVECTGREIMTELLGHLHIEAQAERILDDAICIPCLMPFITSQFLRRRHGDRPHVVPEGWANLAFIGQFCELPNDVVFTVEYSVRSAQTAVYTLLGLDRSAPAVYKGQHDPRVVYGAASALSGH